ncbi:Ribosomal lysine N-methyltransferase set11 [Lecanosticta acicola]|uniref:Ribosomal lysine N-methyltransferase set11 n=1 Tax=Lecanosticta acicola TaxID=111012 RepID=A0AAI8W2D0_9PEZI|nr:Ribosomal lysine N-methyltransferase set11 [Lecanosticta acicola]
MRDGTSDASSTRSSRKRRATGSDIANTKRKASSDEDDKHTLFTKWSQDRGVQIHNVKPASLSGRGIGLVTTGKIKKNERLLFVPEKAMFKPESEATASKGTTVPMSPQAQLTLSIMNECSNPASQYQLWRSTWPTPSDFKASMPLFWRRELQAHLPPSVQQPLDRQKADYQKDKTALQQALSSPDFDYFWAIVNSRSFHFKPAGSRPGHMVLCPFVDYMNHGASGQDTVNVRQTPKGYEVTADRDYEAGEEILATYGPHSNDKLLVHYGFIIDTRPGEPSDDDIRLDHILLPEMSPETKRALQDVGFLGNYALVPATNELCFKTQVAVRAILNTANEWEYYIANGEDLAADQTKRVEEWVRPKLLALKAFAREKIVEVEALFVGEDEAEAVRLLKGRWWQVVHAVDAYMGRS